MIVALTCIACLGLLNVGLGFYVSMVRGKTGVMIGVPEDATHRMTRAVRAHSNTAEYSAMLSVLMYILATQDPQTWVLWCMVGATLARCSIVIGLLTGDLSRPTPARFAGSLGTYIFGIALSIAMLQLAYS